MTAFFWIIRKYESYKNCKTLYSIQSQQLIKDRQFRNIELEHFNYKHLNYHTETFNRFLYYLYCTTISSKVRDFN